MRALTVRQPWAWAIIYGGKDVENRSRNITGAYRGPVAIHAALADADNAPGDLWVKHASHYRQTHEWWRDPDAIHSERGAIIGVVELVDVHSDCTEFAESYGHTPACSPWAMGDHHHIVLASPRPLAAPVRATGRQGLWTLPADVEAAVREQVAR